jgi:hypothetical protein
MQVSNKEKDSLVQQQQEIQLQHEENRNQQKKDRIQPGEDQKQQIKQIEHNREHAAEKYKVYSFSYYP